jgi:hypothetical protein
MKAFVGRTQAKRGFTAQVLFLLLTLGFSVSLTGCLTQGQGTEGGTDVVGNPADVKPPLTTPARTVCDPFNAGVSARDHGVTGTLVYLLDSQPRYNHVADYVANGTPVQSTLYFDKLFIPTRMFDLGFYTQDGTLILNQNNQPLYEYFGLYMETQLMLGAGEAPGWYELAILSDDGATLHQKNADGSQTLIVDNDGDHPTRMGCATHSVYMDGTTKLPVVLQYYQGPRYHISLVTMWRPMPAGHDPTLPPDEIECGRNGNSRYFDPNTTGSPPTPTYYDMLTRGWKPLNNENYYFTQASTSSNPCAQENPLLITNFTVVMSSPTSVTVTWFTSIPASSQLRLKNTLSGATTLSPVDSTLSTSHSMVLSGLTSNTLYAVAGLSVSAGGQAVTSDERAFRTPR